MITAQSKSIVDSITNERCTELAVTLVDIPSLTGNERCMPRSFSTYAPKRAKSSD